MVTLYFAVYFQDGTTYQEQKFSANEYSMALQFAINKRGQMIDFTNQGWYFIH